MASKGLAQVAKDMSSGVPYFKLKDGEQATIRFITPADEIVGAKQHSVKKPDGKTATYWCSETHDCPLCLADLRPSNRALAVVAHRDDTDGNNPGGKPKIFNMSKRTTQAVASMMEEYGDVNGRDFKVKVTGKGSDTTYHFFPKDKEEDPHTYEGVPDLEKYVEANMDQLQAIANLVAGAPAETTENDTKKSDYPF